MMDLLLATSGGESQSASGGYVDDVFSAYTRTGTGADATVTTGIDMTKGYMLWSKGRSGATDHAIYDSARGVTFDLASNSTSGQTTQATGLKSISNTGHTVGSLAKMNTSGATYVDWVFRKAPKFFDVVTYTGDGVAGRQIPHNLGVAPGMIIVKRMDSTGDWWIYHRAAGNFGAYGNPERNFLVLNSAAGIAEDVNAWSNVTPTANIFTVGSSTITTTNTNGAQYVAYLFAHDPSAEGIIQCGSYVGNGSAVGPEVNLGWEPQYVMIKAATVHSAGWYIFDSMRGITTGGLDPALTANTSNAESSFGSADFIDVTSTGFKLKTSDAGVNGGGSPAYIYLAIRRSNKPPTSGTQVYNAIARTGTGTAATVTGVGFAPDTVISAARTSGYDHNFFDRLRGRSQIACTGTYIEYTPSAIADLVSWEMDGYSAGTQSQTSINAPTTVVTWNFRRAPGFFDVVCDTGTGVAHAIAHNLTKAPELIIRKSRSAATQWEVWHSALAATEKLVLNSDAAKATDATAWGSTLPTATQFTVGTGANVNANAATFVTYLFATLAGISKVGRYTGNGSSQTIDCGFGTGARFFLVKATSTTGSWWVYDSARGIVSASDPALRLNSTAAEITSADAVDPAGVGIIVNQEATCSINATGVSYIFLAIA